MKYENLSQRSGCKNLTQSTRIETVILIEEWLYIIYQQ